MPCNDGREHYWDAAMGQHHKRMEQLMEAMLKDKAVPEKYRKLYQEEKARHELALQDAAKGRYPR